MSDQAARLRELVASKEQGGMRTKSFSGPRVIAVTSGKGGVGKSNMVVNLAIQLARLGQRVVIFDADMGLANVDVLMGIVPKFTLHDVVKGEKTLEEIMVTGPYNVQVIPGGTGIQELANLDYYQREKLINGLRVFEERADFLLIDTGAGISKNVLSFVSAADEVVIITTPEPTAITDAYSLIKIISRFKLHPELHLVINRAVSMGEAQLAASKLETAVKRFLQVNLVNLGYIADDRLVGKAVMCQQPFSLLYPQGPAARGINEIALNLSGGGASQPRGMGGFVERLLRLFS